MNHPTRHDVGILLRGEVDIWNEMRKKDLGGRINLMGVDLSGANLNHVNLSGAIIGMANLEGALLSGADLRDACLNLTSLRGADLSHANLSGASLSRANLSDANLTAANLASAVLVAANLGRARLDLANCLGADLTQADLSFSSLVGTSLREAKLDCCCVYGISVWNVDTTAAQQNDLVFRPLLVGEPPIRGGVSVDNIKIAQFIYLLLHNREIRDVLDTITSKVVLILGRFTPQRKVVLDTLRVVLRTRGYVPVLFDFAVPESRDLTETVSTLAHISRFIVADITDAKSIPQELMAIVPALPSVPVQPLLLSSGNEYGMFEHLQRFPWVLQTRRYESIDELLDSLVEHVILPVEAWLRAHRGRLRQSNA